MLYKLQKNYMKKVYCILITIKQDNHFKRVTSKQDKYNFYTTAVLNY